MPGTRRPNAAQVKVLRRLADGGVLMECHHVRLQDGTSYFWSHSPGLERVNAATARVVIRAGWVDDSKSEALSLLQGGTYRISAAGREALEGI